MNFYITKNIPNGEVYTKVSLDVLLDEIEDLTNFLRRSDITDDGIRIIFKRIKELIERNT